MVSPVAILAGGLATRLQPMTERIPKSKGGTTSPYEPAGSAQ